MTDEARLSKPRHRLSGILYMCAASLAFALMAVSVKFTAQTLPVTEIIFFRSLSGTLAIGWLILRKGVPFWGKEKPKLILRGVSGYIAMALHFLTIAKLPIGLAVMLNFTAPVYAAALAVIFLEEKPGWFLWTMIVVSFAGVYLLTLPPGGGPVWTPADLAGNWGYILLGLISGFMAAVAYTAIRSIKHRESPLTIIFYFTFASTVGSVFLLFYGVRWPNFPEWIGLAGVAVGSLYGQLWMTIAFRRAPASLVSPFSYLTPAFSFWAGYVFWRDPVTLYTVIGAGLVFLAGSLISIREALYE
ncbi:MAG: DMT family transporter [Candidatus Omnitrophica bacterium]|nr:DMT family transporter [Candidatus Omnitrophota bacterium]